MGGIINYPKAEGSPDELKEFIKNEGLENSKSVIYLEAYNESIKKNNGLDSHLREIVLRKSNQTSFLMYVRNRSIDQLNWIEKNTKSDQLKNLIKFYKNIVVDELKFDI